MNIASIIAELEQQRDRLSAAIQALSESGRSTGVGKRGRRRRRHLSAAAKARISAAMRKTWAERRKKEKAA
jgi:hypothetical protein